MNITEHGSLSCIRFGNKEIKLLKYQGLFNCAKYMIQKSSYTHLYAATLRSSQYFHELLSTSNTQIFYAIKFDIERFRFAVTDLFYSPIKCPADCGQCRGTLYTITNTLML